MRQLAANGAEVLIRVSAYMDPWGATEPMDWWTVINRARAIDNIAYVVAANQGASLKHYPPYSWPGGSQVIDYDGRILAQASPGPGERIVVAAHSTLPEQPVGQRPLGIGQTQTCLTSGHDVNPLQSEVFGDGASDSIWVRGAS